MTSHQHVWKREPCTLCDGTDQHPREARAVFTCSDCGEVGYQNSLPKALKVRFGEPVAQEGWDAVGEELDRGVSVFLRRAS